MRASPLLLFALFGCATPVAPYAVGGSAGLTLAWEGDDDWRVQVDGELATIERTGGMSRVRVAGCERHVRYQRGARDVHLRSLPCPDADSVSFAFMADTQTDPGIAGQFASLVAGSDASFVVHGGDMVSGGGMKSQWRALFSQLGEMGAEVPLVPAVGNHEYWFDPSGTKIARFLDKATLSDTWYSFSSGPVDIIVLNTAVVEQRELNWAQLSWLRAELDRLDARPERWRVVVFHHPPYSKNFAYAPWYPRKEYEVVRKYYVPLFEARRVDLVMSGHTHLFERSTRGGVEYLVGGAAGGLLGIAGGDNVHSRRSEPTRSLSRVRASRTTFTVDTVNLQGETIDKIVLARRPELAQR